MDEDQMYTFRLSNNEAIYLGRHLSAELEEDYLCLSVPIIVLVSLYSIIPPFLYHIP